jgi:hypothetical protein
MVNVLCSLVNVNRMNRGEVAAGLSDVLIEAAALTLLAE